MKDPYVVELGEKVDISGLSDFQVEDYRNKLRRRGLDLGLGFTGNVIVGSYVPSHSQQAEGE